MSLLITLYLWLHATPTTEECFSNGKLYTLVKGVPVDSIDVKLRFRIIDERIDYTLEQRIKEKERILEVIKTKHCKF